MKYQLYERWWHGDVVTHIRTQTHKLKLHKMCKTTTCERILVHVQIPAHIFIRAHQKIIYAYIYIYILACSSTSSLPLFFFAKETVIS